MVEHNLSVVENLSDTITVLSRGEVLAEGDYATVSRNPAGHRGLHGGRAMPERRGSLRRRATCTPGTASRTSCTAWTSTCGRARW